MIAEMKQIKKNFARRFPKLVSRYCGSEPLFYKLPVGYHKMTVLGTRMVVEVTKDQMFRLTGKMSKPAKASPNPFAEMQCGRIIRNRRSNRRYVVLGNYGTFVVAVDEMVVMNADEWDVVQPV